MSAGITDQDKSFVVIKPAWHGLSTILEAPPTSEEAIKEAGLDWTVEVHPTFVRIGDQEIEVPRLATIRMDTNTVLGSVGGQYTPLQNWKAFDFFDPLIESGVAQYETAGSLFGGQKVWILARLKGDIDLGSGDTIAKYVLLSNSFDGLSTLVVKITPTRVVCWNTLSGALRRKGTEEFKIRHTRSIEDRTEKALNLLHEVSERYEKLALVWKAMTEFEMPAIEQLKYLEEVYPIPEDAKRTSQKEAKRYEVARLMSDGAGQTLATADRTLWGAYNGITNMTTHNVSTRKGNSREKHLDQLWNGRLGSENAHAFDVALKIMSDAKVEIEGEKILDFLNS